MDKALSVLEVAKIVVDSLFDNITDPYIVNGSGQNPTCYIQGRCQDETASVLVHTYDSMMFIRVSTVNNPPDGYTFDFMIIAETATEETINKYMAYAHSQL